MKPYKAVIFDYGNTLVQSASLSDTLSMVLSHERAPDVGAAIERIIQSLYRPDQTDQPDWRRVWSAAFREFNVPFNEAVAWAHLEAFLTMGQPYSYAQPVLELLRKRNISVGLLSNATGPLELFKADLARRNWESFFNTAVWSCGLHIRKPAKAAFEACLSELRANAEHTLMVGDSEIADIKGGNQAGLDTLKVGAVQSHDSEVTFQVGREGMLGWFQTHFSNETYPL